MRCLLEKCIPIIAVALLSCPGCGGTLGVVPVSGRLTINGQPLADMHVTFEPATNTGSLTHRLTASVGKTDREGRFVLEAVDAEGRKGAVAGEHRVTIISLSEAYRGAFDERAADNGKSNIKLPAKCYDGSIRVVIPPDGTDETNIEL